MRPAAFRWQVERLLSKGYRAATFTEAVTSTQGRYLAVTFDDAYRSVLDLAYPALERLGVPATVFAPTSFIGLAEPMSWPGIEEWAGGEHASELVPMGWDELARLADSGWEIGSHTRSHPRLSTLRGPSLDEELTLSRAEIEQRLGRPCESLAYPYGDFDEEVIAAAGRAGYRAAATLPRRLVGSRALAWPRVGIYRADGRARFCAKVSPSVRRLRSSPAWTLVDGARRSVGRPTSRG